MVQIENPTRFKFDTPEGEKSLSDLFDGRKQLIIYHFMLGLEDEQGCVGCSFCMDHIPDLRHLHSRDTTFVAVATAPLDKATAFKERMEWKFPLYSSAKTVQAWKEAEAAGEIVTWKPGNGYFGLCVFLQDGNDVYHTYSTTDRGLEIILSTYRLLDMTPLGRQEPTKLKGEEIYDGEALIYISHVIFYWLIMLIVTTEAKLSNDLEAVKVREWRYKLQKSFLDAKRLPKDEVRL